jgi:hypothetical protein
MLRRMMALALAMLMMAQPVIAGTATYSGTSSTDWTETWTSKYNASTGLRYTKVTNMYGVYRSWVYEFTGITRTSGKYYDGSREKTYYNPLTGVSRYSWRGADGTYVGLSYSPLGSSGTYRGPDGTTAGWAADGSGVTVRITPAHA